MIQGRATEDIESDNSNSSMSANQGTSVGAQRAQDDHEEEVFGTPYPTKTSQFVQILKADLVGAIVRYLRASTRPSE